MICHPLKEEKSIDQMISFVQKGNIDAQNDLLKTYKPFVAKCVSEVCKRYIDPTRDDEFSVGLLGFNEAMLHYSSERGCSFFSFANIVIKRKVIDYIRAKQRVLATVSLDEVHDEENMENPCEIAAAKQFYYDQQEAWYRREEIQDFSEKLAGFKMTLTELIFISPKHKDARDSSVRIARILMDVPSLRAFVKRRKMLPIKELLNYVTVSKKTLERNRKFILATFIILNEEYLYLNEYLKGLGQ